MKKLILVSTALVSALTTSLVAQNSKNVERAKEHYRAAEAAIENGKPKVAELQLREAIRLAPNFHVAREKLNYVRRNMTSLETQKLRVAMTKVKIEKLDLDETAGSDALKIFFQLLSNAADKQKIEVQKNYVLKDSTGSIAKRKVTLQLNNIPAHAAFDILLEQLGAKHTFEKYTIKITPRGTTK